MQPPTRTLIILAVSLAAACGSPEPAPTASVQEAIWSNGDFEGDGIGTTPPTGWSITTYQNAGISGTSTTPPSSFSALNLSSSAGTGKIETFIVGGTTLGQADPDLGTGQSLRYPLFGARAVRVNYKDATDSGKNKNANSLQQTMTVSASDVDPTDGQVHVRFAIAPVLENPSHGYTQQPFYYVELTNVTRGTILYHDFNVAGQSGVPWNTTTSVVTGNATQWLNWQLVDIAPGPATIATGDQVKLTVVGSGCSLGGHFGRIYLDGIGPTVPGLYTWATGAQTASAGSNLTYTFFYSNGGTSSGIGTHVDFVTPPQTTFVSASLGTSCTAPAVGATGTVSCPLGTLGAGASGTFTVTVKIGATATSSIVNGNYSIGAVNAATLLGAKVTTTIPGSATSFANVSVTQSANRTVVNWAQTIQYTIKVANAGPTAIATGGLTVTDTMPAQLAGVTWSCTRTAGSSGSTKCGTSSGSGNISVRPKIGSGGELTYTVSGTVVSGSGLGSVTHTMTAGAQTTTTDPDPTNNTAVLTIPIGTSRTLSLTKSGGASNGTLSSSPSGISCGSACSSSTANFADSSSVVLTATPIGGASFTSWSGACMGSARTCTVTMSGNQSVTATFAAAPAVGAAAIVYPYAGSGQLALTGSVFTTPLAALVTDASGNVLSGITVTFGGPSSGAGAGFTSVTTTNAAGIATATATANATPGSYAVTASVQSVTTPASFNLTNVGPATQLVYLTGGNVSDPQQAPTGGAFSSSLAAITRDAAGNPVPGATVTYAAPSSGASATLTATSATSDANGIVQVAATANGVAGSYTITATLAGATPVTFNLQNLSPGPANLIVVGGSDQTTDPSTAFASPLTVVVADAVGNALPNVTVTFAAPSSGAAATLDHTQVTTDSLGQASVNATANATAGTYTVSATVSGVTPATFTLVNNGTQFIDVLSGSPQDATVGASFGAALVAVLTDSNGDPVSGVTVTFTVPASGAKASLSASTAVTDTSGLASVTATAGTVAGAYTVNAAAPLAGDLASFALTNDSGPAASISAASGGGQTATVGAAFAAPLVARVADASGNPVAGATVSFAAPSSGATASLGSATAVTDSSGLARVTPTAGAVAGSYSVLASVTGIGGSASFSLTNLVGAAATIAVNSGSPQSATVGTSFAPIVALVTDASGNPVSGATVSFTTPSSGPSATVAGTATTSAAGLASVTPTAGAVAGHYVVSASVGGVTGTADFSLTNLAGAPAAIAVSSGSPQSATIGTSFSSALVAIVTDASGNPVFGATVSFTAPSSGASATVAGTATTSVAGLASVTPTAGSVVGSYVVSASVGGVTGTADFSLTNLSASAVAAIAVDSGSPQSTTVGAAFSPIVAKVTDGNGSGVAGVTVSFTAPSTGATATMAATATTDSAGLASVTPTADTIAGAYTVSATATGVTGSADFSLTNTAGAAAAIAVNSGSPQSATVATAFAPIVAKVTDSHGNPVSGTTVSFTAPTSGATATVAATATTDSAGLASVTPTADTIAGAYTVSATATGVTGSADFSLTNTAGAAAAIAVNSGSPQSATVATVFAPIVAKVTDSHGNPVSGTTVSFTAPTSGATATMAATATTDSAGLASVTPTAGTIAGAYTVSATATGVTGSADFSLTNTAGAAAAIAVNSGSPQSATVATVFAPIVAKVTDSHGNPVSGTTVSFTAPTSGATATVAATATTNSAGLASVTPTADTIAGAYTVSATATGVTGSADFSLTNTAGAAAAIAVNSGSPQSATVATAFAPIVAKVTDSHGNPVSGTTVSFTAPSTGATATVAATATTDSAGLASVTPTADTIAGAYTVSATATGVTGSADFSLTNTAGAAAAIAVNSGSPQSATVATAFAPIVAKVTDSHGNPVSGTTVSFTAPASSASAALGAASATTGADGIAQITASANTIAGDYDVTASLAGGASCAFHLTNTAGIPASITAAASATPQQMTVALPYAEPLAVTVRDRYGNPVPGAAVGYTVPGDGPSVALSATTATTDATGGAAVDATANQLTGSFLVRAAVDGVTDAAAFALGNIAGSPATLVIVEGDPQSATVDTDFAPLVIQVLDVFDNPVPTAVVSFVASPGDATAVLASGSAQSDAGGLATMSAHAGTIAGAYTVTASLPSAASPVSFALTNTPGAAATITAEPSSTPQNAQVDHPFLRPLVAQVLDGFANPVPGVTVTFAAPATPATGALATTTATTSSDGRVNTTITAGTVAGTYAITATATDVATSASFALANLAGEAHTITASAGAGQSATVATGFAAPIVALVQDAHGNAVSEATVVFTAPMTGATASPAHAEVTTGADGTAQTALTCAHVAGAFAILATTGGAAAPAEFALSALPGSPTTATALASATPQATEVEHPFTHPLALAIADAYGNPVPGAHVAFAAPNAPGAQLSTDAATSDAGGIAFALAIADHTAGGYRVTASVAGTADVPFELTNTAAAPSAVLLTGGGAQRTLATTAFAAPVTARVVDAFGNSIAGVAVAFSAPSTGATATMSDPTPVSDASGDVSVALTAGPLVGHFLLSAQVAGATAPATAALEVMAIPTTITVSAPTGMPVNDDTDVTITVSSALGAPGGTVDVLAADGTRLASAALDRGSATVAVSGLTIGSHAVTARYAAQGSYGASVSASVTFELTGDTGSLSGGGCSATGARDPRSLVGLGLAGLVALAIRRRRRSAGVLGFAAIVGAATTGATASADPSARAIDRYRAASPDSAWFAVDSATFAGEREVAIVLVSDYAREPLDIYDANGAVRAQVVRDSLVGHLGGSVTLRDRLRLSAAAVMATWQDGPGGMYNGVHLPAPRFAFGDVTLAGDVRVVGQPGSALRVVAGLQLTTPTGQRTSYMSDARFAGEPRVLVAGSLRGVEYAGGASLFLRRETMFAGSSFGSELRYQAALGERLLDGKLLFGPELFGAAPLGGHAAVGAPLELQVGGHYAASEHLRVGVAAGLGVVNAIGEPHLRALVSLHWTP